MIIIGYQGIGKSSLAATNLKYIDLESSCFYYNGVRPDDWYRYYCNIAHHLSLQGYSVFVSSHEVVRNELKWYMDKGLEKVVCVYPSLSLKDDWIRKLANRYNNCSTEKNFKAWMNAVDRYEDNITEIKNCGIPGIEILSMDYVLEDLIGYDKSFD